MTFRISSNQQTAFAINHTANLNASLSKLQQQVSTGLRILKPSDDPIAQHQVLQNRARSRRSDVEQTIITDLTSRLNFSVTHLVEANQLLARAKQIAIRGVQAVDESESRALAQEVENLLDRMLSIANERLEAGHAFGGVTSGKTPFLVQSSFDQAEGFEVEYAGRQHGNELLLGNQFAVTSDLAGDQVFQSRQRGETLYLGHSGAAPGIGTDSAQGRRNLHVRHELTTFAPGSGVQAGTSSAEKDSIIAPLGDYYLTINDTSGTGTAGTIALNEGPPIPFTSSDTDLQLLGPLGEALYVDTTSITPGFSGRIDISASGTIAIGDGAAVQIDFSQNQQLFDDHGRVTNVDSTQIRAAGTDSIEYVGTGDVFQTMLALRDDLLNQRGLSKGELAEAFERLEIELDRHGDNLLQAVASQSIELQNMEALQSRSADLQLDLQQRINEFEGADLAEVILHLQNEQNLLQYTLASTAAIVNQSILDYL